MNQSNPDISWLYNPIGKSLVRIAMPAYPDFIARVFDLAAYVQLVRAQLEARLANVASDQMPSFLGAVGPDARNPYTGQSFTWDAATHKLSFTPMSNHPWRTFSFSAFVPPPTSISAR